VDCAWHSQELSLLHGDHLGYYSGISLPENATYKLGGMGTQVSNSNVVISTGYCSI